MLVISVVGRQSKRGAQLSVGQVDESVYGTKTKQIPPQCLQEIQVYGTTNVVAWAKTLLPVQVCH